MAWTGQTFTVGQILTAAQMNNLQADITAAFNKDVGAPVLANSYIVQAMVDSAAIGRAALKSTTASGSVTIGTDASSSYSLAGGTYSWWTGSSDFADATAAMAFGNGDTAAGVIGLRNTGNSSYVFYVDERYIQSSPPWDNGDGLIGIFIYLMFDDASGDLIGISVSTEPTWAYHGPTCIEPQFIDADGKLFRDEQEIISEIGGPMEISSILKTGSSQQKNTLLDRLSSDPMKRIEITMAYKNRDMNLCPHPWFHNDSTGKTIYMVDPVSNEADKLAYLLDVNGAREVRDMVENGFIHIDRNLIIQRSMPDNIQALQVTIK